MSNFNTQYSTPLDRGYYNTPFNQEPGPGQDVNAPIISAKDLGITVVEKDQMTGGNIIQNVQAAIRKGVSSIQLVFTTPSHSPFGGRPKAYGDEVREAIRELAKANEVSIGGVEMPTSSMSNLSGFDGRQGFSEEKRHRDMQEVRDAIKFTADVAGGGGVDIWSQEFPQTMFDARWNQEGKWAGQFAQHPGEKEDAVKHLVDTETGNLITSVRVNQERKVFKWNTADRDGSYIDPRTGEQMNVEKGQYIDYDGRPLKIDQRVPYLNDRGEPVIETKTITDFKEEANDWTQTKGREISPEEAFYFSQVQQQKQEAIGQKERFANERNRRVRIMQFAEEDIQEAQQKMQLLRDNPDGYKERYKREGDPFNLQDEMKKLQRDVQRDIMQIQESREEIKSYNDLVASQELKVQQLEAEGEKVKTIGEFAKEKTFESYADLAIDAMRETEANPHAKKDLYVGPELGWPGAFGGHPDEFIEIVKKSRTKMKEKLIKNWGYTEKEAAERSKRHIKGLFDTSHMGMWLRHFEKDPKESQEQHLKRFNTWYMEQVDKLIKSGTVGSIQAVDSASGAHGHLPPGSGIFPIIETVKKFKESGFKGFIVSEGHEEEQFGHGRIFTQLWKGTGAAYGISAGGPLQWRSISGGYFGRTYTPNFIVGGYSPSNDFRLWSEVPLE